MKILQRVAILLFFALSVNCTRNTEITWKIADNPIVTKWAEDVDPLKPWLQYPRPDLKRNAWMNLNGLWEYAITAKGTKPEKWDGNILVPYPVESALSGVKKRVSESENLWYRRTFKVPNVWSKKQILLNFEACDWETTVWIDGKEAGSHKGGYDPFTFNITETLADQKEHEILVCVWDPTNKGAQPRGKQVSNPGGIWYTPTTGIWQTVWIEPVNASYISSFRTVTNIDNGTVTFIADVKNGETSTLNFIIRDKDSKVAEVSGKPGEEITARIENPQLWSPENPFLYDVEAKLKNGNKVVDEIRTYTGLRKISTGKTDDGFTRILLNNKFIFQNGPLDQGFWPDGLYTPPTEKAMVYDIEMTKKMGFNMLRKHVKVENRIFYYWCDKLGILVWQDMPSGDRHINGSMPDIEKSKEATEQYEYELKRMIDTKYNHPSIIMWVPFNEGWGQFETGRITQLTKDYDPTRLVNSASGWTDRGTGDVNDIHHYPDPVCPPAEEKRAIVLGEFGGLGLPLQGHTWEQKNWGYRNMEDSLQLLSKYEAYYDQVHKFVKENGLSATIYTQTTDVETETNGLMTYDRKVNKMGVENVFRANNNIVPPSLTTDVRMFTDTFMAEMVSSRPGGKIYYTTDGSEPTEKSALFSGPVKISETTTIKAFTKWDDAESRVTSFLIEKSAPLGAVEVGKVKPGLKAAVYDGRFTTIPEFSGMKPVQTKIVKEVSHSVSGKNSFFGIVFEGYINIPADGVYGLYINSDDGSRMTIGETEPVLNDGIHGMREEGRSYPLAKGFHKIKIEYFQGEGGVGLEFNVTAPGQQKMAVPAAWLNN
ncbi:MAG: chitobiase/beta-hexosaminidase C-terminal domain-containing protein [Bacteroidales bacterium]|nr:chitobiase/beta-hexosaminidase C-terminal domain-containing protein [Bacteroidales bacterium]